MIWVGTMAGVYRYQSMADSFALFQLLPPIKVENIMEDKDGKIWFVAGGKGFTVTTLGYQGIKRSAFI